MVSVSIIMPLYNAAKYLEESIKSIQRQTLIDFELICIDDASTDATMEILRGFQREDDRIRIFSNEAHCGAAVSRNRGMQEARGTYLAFLDGDDIFEEEMLECAFRTAEEKQTDVVTFELKHVSSEDIYRKQRVFHSDAFYERYSSDVFEVRKYMSYEFGNWDFSMENKLFRKTFIFSNHLEFQNLSCANDVYFVCMALLLSKKLLHLKDDRVMIYQREHAEPTRISYDRDPKCTYLAFLHIMEELQNRNKFSEVYEHYYYRLFRALRGALRQCKTEEKARIFYQFLQEEGIDKLCSADREYYGKLNIYIKNPLEQFKTQEFDSGWYQKVSELELQLNQKSNSESLMNLFAEYKAHKKSIGVWGAGENGVVFLKFCIENNLKVDMVIDKSTEKQGKSVEGYLVTAPENIGDKLQVVIVTARLIAESVKKELAGRDIEVIDINQFLYLY